MLYRNLKLILSTFTVLLLGLSAILPVNASENVSTPKLQASNKSKSAKDAVNVKPILAELRTLVEEYYPRAKIKETENSLEASYKTKTAISVYTKRKETMPKVGGLYLVVGLKPGKYSGRDRLNVEEIHFYYEQMTLAPFSKAGDCHLYAQMSYSANSATEFKGNFKRIIRSFGDSKTAEVQSTANSSVKPQNKQKQTKAANTKPNKTTKVSQTSSKQKPTSRVISKNGSNSDKLFLWKATKGNETVYLLGTIHVAKKNFYPLPKGLLDAYEESNHLLVEVDITNPKLAKEMLASRKKANGLYKPPTKLRDRLNPKTRKVFEDYLKWSGESWDMYNRFKPWLAADILSGSIPRRGEILKFSGRYGIDLFLLKQAKLNDIPVSSLESTDREFVSQLSEPAAETRLLVYLLQLKNSAEDIEEIFDVWNAGDLDGMAELDLRQERKYPLLREYNKILLDDRNLKMVSKLLELMPKFRGPHFVAVGSAHMTGETGLVDQLKKHGFKVKQVEKARPSMEGLEVKDVSAEYKFEDGPCLSWRKQLYNEIQACKAKGVGIQGYMNSFNYLESCVKNGFKSSQVKKEVKRIESGISKQLAPLRPHVITPYCIKLEKLISEKLKSVSALSESCTLACTIDKSGNILDLKPSINNKTASSLNQLAIKEIEEIGPFPKPPKAPLRLKMVASNNVKDIEVWYRGVIDYKNFMHDMRARIKKHWRPSHSKSKLLTASFKIYRNGTVGSIRIKRSSGSRSADEAAIKAVDEASPFLKLPDGSRKFVNLNFKFYYQASR